jgi:nicotinamide-nucleotide amidase
MMGRCTEEMNTFDTEMEILISQLAETLQRSGWLLACAESCTGGWISKCCTDREGSSVWFDRGYIAYSYPAKTEMLGISEQRLLHFGAVSREIACDLAEGVRSRSGVQVSLAVTGVAGPGGGTESKPVGTVWFAWAVEGRPTEAECQRFSGDREAVRRQSALFALQGLLQRLA